MDNVIEINVEPRKEWVAPELKKVDIEQITAGDNHVHNDGFLSS
jgi:hypothetical protein